MSTTAPQAPGITRIDLQRHDLSVPGREVIQNRVEISPEALNIGSARPVHGVSKSHPRGAMRGRPWA
jgi:hypothetical protein